MNGQNDPDHIQTSLALSLSQSLLRSEINFTIVGQYLPSE